MGIFVTRFVLLSFLIVAGVEHGQAQTNGEVRRPRGIYTVVDVERAGAIQRASISFH